MRSDIAYSNDTRYKDFQDSRGKSSPRRATSLDRDRGNRSEDYDPRGIASATIRKHGKHTPRTSAQGVGRFYRTLYADGMSAIYQTDIDSRYFVTAHASDIAEVIRVHGLTPTGGRTYAPYRKHSDARGRWVRVEVRKP